MNRAVNQTRWGVATLQNVIMVPIFAGMLVLTHVNTERGIDGIRDPTFRTLNELRELRGEHMQLVAATIGLTCVAVLGISASAAHLYTITSATSVAVISTLAKVGAVAVGYIVFGKDLPRLEIAAFGATLCGGLLFAHQRRKHRREKECAATLAAERTRQRLAVELADLSARHRKYPSPLTSPERELGRCSEEAGHAISRV